MKMIMTMMMIISVKIMRHVGPSPCCRVTSDLRHIHHTATLSAVNKIHCTVCAKYLKADMCACAVGNGPCMCSVHSAKETVHCVHVCAQCAKITVHCVHVCAQCAVHMVGTMLGEWRLSCHKYPCCSHHILSPASLSSSSPESSDLIFGGIFQLL